MAEPSERADGIGTMILREIGETPELVKIAGRNGGGMLRAGARGVGDWWKAVAGWFSFVHHRRPDERFDVFPSMLRMAEILAVFASILALLVLFADPVYLAAVREESFEPGRAFEIITELGQSDWVLYSTGIALILYSLVRPGGLVARSRHVAHTVLLAVYYVFTTVAFSGIIASALKNLIGRARPPYVTGAEVWESFPLRDSYDFASFPSGHATTAGALTIALALLFPRMRVFFILAGIWIAISRPALGVHFISDIFAGFCFGGAFSYFYARSFARKRLLFGYDEEGGIEPRFRLPRLARSKTG